MKLYEYNQNPSGGHFVGSYSKIFVIANNPEQADQFFLELGFGYFDGVDTGIDCECCGDRWKRTKHFVEVDDVEGFMIQENDPHTSKRHYSLYGLRIIITDKEKDTYWITDGKNIYKTNSSSV